MIGLDTNVIVRYAVRDDPEQTAQADALFERLTARQPGFVATVALAETWWVLRQVYRLDRAAVIAFIRQLLASDELRVQDLAAARRALALAESGADFADALIAQAAEQAGCARVASFDQRAVRVGMTAVADLIAGGT